MLRSDEPIPQGDDELGQTTNTDWVTIPSGQTEIGDLDRSAIVHEQIARLEISVQNPSLMTIGYGREKLEHERLDLGLQEGRGHDGEQGFEVMLDEVHDDEHPFTGKMLREVF